MTPSIIAEKYKTGRGQRSWYRIAPLAVLAALVFGCSKNQAGPGGFMMPPTPVEVSEVKVQKVTDTFDAVGTIEAIQGVTIVSEIDAMVVDLPFAEGSAVKKGDLIALLDDAQLAAEVARSEALEEQSHVTYKRVKALVDANMGSQQDLDDASSALKVADANLTMAKARLAKTRIVAPFDGIVGARKVSVGTFLRTGQEITELANIDSIRVNFSAPENFLTRLRRNADVTVSTTAYPDHEIKGKIVVVEPVLDPGTRNGRVVASMSNPERNFIPGMSANIKATLTERPNAITIPSEAIFANGNQSFVYMVKPDSTVARMAVTLGTRMADAVEILSGLDAGTQIVAAGHQKLYEGAKVFPMGNQAPSNQ